MRITKHHDLVKFLRAAVIQRRQKEKETASVAVSYCKIAIRCYRVGSAGFRSLRFFRNAMIGFPQLPQNENSGQPSPMTTFSSRFLICFLQLSHFVTSIGEAELCLRSLELCDAGLVLSQLVFVPELLRADGVLLSERLNSFQDAV
jgi:hypothetical protein